MFVRKEVFNRVRDELNSTVDDLTIKINDAESRFIAAQTKIVDQEKNNRIMLNKVAALENQLIDSQNKITDQGSRLIKVEKDNETLSSNVEVKLKTA